MMNKTIVTFTLVGLLALGAGSALAQRGGGRGNNPITPNPSCTGDCLGAQNGPNGMQNGMNGANGMQNGANGMQNGANGMRGGRFGAPGAGMSAAVGTLSEDLQAQLIAGWQDEVNAYAFYSAMIEQFGEVSPFVELQRAEAQHQSAWERQAARFGVTLPEAAASVTFSSFETVGEAAAYALQLEEDNAGLYDQLLTSFADYPSLTRVATMLRSASLERHMTLLALYAE